MSVLRSLFMAGIFVCSTAVSIVQASTNSPVSQQRSPDSACIDCHKPQTEGMDGKHHGAINPNTQLPLTCTNCHGTPSYNHREGVKDVMRFNQPMFSVEQQNGVCLSCHLPEKLQQAFWPHDVHLAKVSCASCHQLHPTTNTMKELNDKGRIKLCVDCHRQQQDNPAFNPAAVKLGKELP
jgi:cytochrome c-type protein NrfB